MELPGEVSRISSVTTSSGGRKLYDNIEVSIAGDRARIFLPRSVVANSSTAVGAVWFYHGAVQQGDEANGHNAMNGGFKYPGELAVDQGAIAICINAGGDQLSNEFAQRAQAAAWKYLKSLFNVQMNFLRATSAGGALASYTYGNQLMPYITGLYLMNGVYDIEALYNSGLDARYFVGRVFGYDAGRIAAANPARIALASWRTDNVKALVSDAAHPDDTVEPGQHGIALIRKIKGTAADAELEYHTSGHSTPSSSHKDMIVTFGGWRDAALY